METGIIEYDNFLLSSGEQIAIVGPNGSGKSTLIEYVRGAKQPLPGHTARFAAVNGRSIKELTRYITFRDSYGSADSTYYYQQRWNTTEIEDYPFIRDIFPDIADSAWKETLFRVFSMERILDKRIVTLSSGEMRKYQLARMLSQNPALLIVESPYIGLDAPTRKELDTLFRHLIAEWNMQIILILSRAAEIPDFITHVYPVSNGIFLDKRTRQDFSDNADRIFPDNSSGFAEEEHLIDSLPVTETDCRELVYCNNVSLKYGGRTILNPVTWSISKGQRWALLGPNGCGKSALLSMIYADNPQSYACDISLFGYKRGSGESIWEIKKQIGYVSPEMHRSYMRHLPVSDIVASGLYDTIGLYRHISEQDISRCRIWMRIFGITQFTDRDFTTLSSGEQRLVLLARAFVKNPQLVILDEPLHGLDKYNRIKVMHIINHYCKHFDRSAIIVTHYPEELPDCITNQKVLERP